LLDQLEDDGTIADFKTGAAVVGVSLAIVAMVCVAAPAAALSLAIGGAIVASTVLSVDFWRLTEGHCGAGTIAVDLAGVAFSGWGAAAGLKGLGSAVSGTSALGVAGGQFASAGLMGVSALIGDR
jgi:hypothetical protein